MLPVIIAIRCQILRLKCAKIDFGCGFTPDPAGPGSLQRSSRPSSWNKGDLLLSEVERYRKGKEGQGREGRGGDRREGNGVEPHMYLSIFLRIAYAIIRQP